MRTKKEISREQRPGGYVVVKALMDGADVGSPDFEMEWAETLSGDYIGDVETAEFLCDKRGIAPELRNGEGKTCEIGFCEREQKWYGWSHRAIGGFGIGDITEKGDACTESGWTDDYLADHPDDLPVPVGFEVKTLDDAKRCAIAFAACVS